MAFSGKDGITFLLYSAQSGGSSGMFIKGSRLVPGSIFQQRINPRASNVNPRRFARNSSAACRRRAPEAPRRKHKKTGTPHCQRASLFWMKIQGAGRSPVVVRFFADFHAAERPLRRGWMITQKRSG
jgi:hypothetical protein